MFKLATGLAAVSCLTFIACDKGPANSAPIADAPAARGTPAAVHQVPPAMAGSISGNVVETMNSGGYTYLQVDTGSKRLWAAGPEVQVAVGDQVAFPTGSPMTNFHSSTLNRTFEMVHFVPRISVGGQPMPTGTPKLPAGHPRTDVAPSGAVPSEASASPVPSGGKSIADCFAEAAALSGKPVKIRGKVVKFNGGIMGKNWLHVQDGTGGPTTNDLLVTTQETAAVGDTIVATGTLATDKDFGAGYKYSVLLEDAQVVVE